MIYKIYPRGIYIYIYIWKCKFKILKHFSVKKIIVKKLFYKYTSNVIKCQMHNQ